MIEETRTVEAQHGKSSRPGAEEDTVDAPMIAVLGFIAAILAFVVILGLVVLFHKMETSAREQKYAPPAGLSKLQADQRAKLAEYGYVDEKKGVVRIPIEDAMVLVTKEYEAAQKKPAASP